MSLTDMDVKEFQQTLAFLTTGQQHLETLAVVWPDMQPCADEQKSLNRRIYDFVQANKGQQLTLGVEAA